MKKKISITLVALALAALLVFCLVGCTVSGTYEGVIGKMEFSGKNFTYKIDDKTIAEGTFTTEAYKEEYKSDLASLKIDQEYVKGVIKYQDKDGNGAGIGFYGKNKDGQSYVTYLIAVFVKK